MILTCPDCATSYFVDDDRIPPAGRSVKCSSCGSRWHATPEELPAEPESQPPEEPEAPEPDAEIEAVPAPEPAKSKAKRERALKPPRKGPPLWVFLIAGGVGAMLAGALSAAVFRQPIVDALPSAAPVFKAVGLKVNDTGLVIEDLKFEPRFQLGRPALLVSGSIHNIRDESRTAPALRVRLLGDEGKDLGGVVARTTNAVVPAGGRRYFAITVANPPVDTRSAEVVFDGDVDQGPPSAAAHSSPTAHPAPPPHPPVAHAPTPVEAQPLPAESPHALTKPDAH